MFLASVILVQILEVLRKIGKRLHDWVTLIGNGSKIQQGLVRHIPTSGVMADVKTELLCTMKVIPAPTKMAM